MDRAEIVASLTRLVVAHSPSGHEDEIQPIIMEEFRRRADDVWMDPAGNGICRIRGASAKSPVIVTAHMDEIGMLVKRVEDKGILRVDKVGGAWPYKYGEGPVDILGDCGRALCGQPHPRGDDDRPGDRHHRPGVRRGEHGGSHHLLFGRHHVR